MPSRRGGLAAAVLDGAIHVIGGETRGSVFANHEVYDPATDRWTTAAALPVARHGLAAAAVGGKLYVIGGGPKAGVSQTDAVDVFPPPEGPPTSTASVCENPALGPPPPDRERKRLNSRHRH